MKISKFVFKILITTLFFIACTSDNELNKNSMSDNITFQKMNKDTKRVSKIKVLNKLDINSYGEMVLVKPKNELFNFVSVKVEEPININGFHVESNIIDATFENEFTNKMPHLIYLQRIISNGFIKIIEIVNINTRKIISYTLIGIEESEYLQFRKIYYTFGLERVMCFQNFTACTQQLSENLDGGTNAVVCDWMPCNTLVYATCLVFEFEGLMEEQMDGEDNPHFYCGGCDIIYGNL